MDLKEFDARLHDADVKLKRLKALYEQWFQGIERIEPTVARKDLERLFALLAKNKPRNTAARFRLQQLSARYATYLTYWGRIARQIEEGTYERDLRRVARRRMTREARARERERTSTPSYELDLEEDIPLDDLLDDEFASIFDELEAPAPAPPPKRAAAPLSAFSPFAMIPAKKRESPESKRAEPAAIPAASTPAASTPAASTPAASTPAASPPPEPVRKPPPPPARKPPAATRPKPPPPPPPRKKAPPPPPSIAERTQRRKEPVTATFSKPKSE